MLVENQFSPSPALSETLKKLQSTALVIGVIGILAVAAGFFITPREQFFHSYLVGFLFWTGAAVGSLALLMIHFMAGGAWGMMIRRTAEAGSRTLPLMMVLVVPVLAGVFQIYEWSQPGVVAHDKVLQGKQFYLNVNFWWGRSILFFGVWWFIMRMLNKWSLEQDRTGDVKYAKKMERLSGAGLVIYAYTMTFAVTDWVMSLEPHWFSTVYGLLLCVGQVMSALSTLVAVFILMADKPPLAGLITKRHLHDMGKLMLALTMLWAYLSFSQLILIWSGNLPEEITYYVNRLNGGWQYVGAILMLFHFAFPFLMLLSQGLKKNPKTLQRIALYIIVIRVIDVFWLVEPSIHAKNLQVHWLDIVTPIGIGGLWVAYFCYQLRQRPLLPINAPDLQKALNHGRHHH